MTVRLWLVAVSLSCSLIVGCSESRVSGDLDVLGLSGACVPSGPPRQVLVAPGLISLEDGEILVNVDFEVTASLNYDIGVATSGVNAGDAYDVQADMSFDIERPLNLNGPGDWPIVVLVETGGGEGALSIDGLLYSVDDTSYLAPADFELVVAESCV